MTKLDRIDKIYKISGPTSPLLILFILLILSKVGLEPLPCADYYSREPQTVRPQNGRTQSLFSLLCHAQRAWSNAEPAWRTFAHLTIM